MIKHSEASPIFSLADVFIHTVQKVDCFEDLGAAHDGHHIGLFFRKLVKTQMHIDYQNPYVLNRFCRMFNFVNARGSIYGHLFVVSDTSRVTLADHKMLITCNKKELYDYAQVPLTSEKQKLLIYKTSTGSVLAISGNDDSPYLVTEPV